VKKPLAIFGVLTILFWSSFLVYVFMYPLETWLRYEPLQFWLSLGLILTGVISGVLLIVHPRSGRILAITLCAGLLAYRLWEILSSFPHIGERLHAIFFLLLPRKPVYVIHSEIVSVLFFIITIVFLGRKSRT
jgi:hypothetical protein